LPLDSGGAISWKNPWAIELNQLQTLGLHVITAAHELRHQQQIVALNLATEPGPVDMAAMDMRAKEGAPTIATRLQSKDRRYFLGKDAPKDVQHQERAQLDDADRKTNYFKNNLPGYYYYYYYYYYWFKQYIPRYCDKELGPFLTTKYLTDYDWPKSGNKKVKALYQAINSFRMESEFWTKNDALLKEFIAAYVPWEKAAIAKSLDEAAARQAVDKVWGPTLAAVKDRIRALRHRLLLGSPESRACAVVAQPHHAARSLDCPQHEPHRWPSVHHPGVQLHRLPGQLSAKWL
jgi:hypothetical protein